MKVQIRPLAQDCLADFLHFFDDVGFADNRDWSGCYCCFYHHDAAGGSWEKRTREGNRNAARELIEKSRMKGYLAYRDGNPVGWCNVNAKSAYALLASDSALADSDTGRTRSIVCFLIAPGFRGQGIARQLLERACSDTGNDGFAFLEAYPRKDAATNAAHYHGPIEMYRKAGFALHKEMDSFWIVRRSL